MALELADLPVRPITVDEALRMFDAGVFEEPGRIELVRGVLLERPVSSPQHVEVKNRVWRWLRAFEPGVLRLEDPLVAADGISMPQPDVAIVMPGDYSRAHPTSALFVIEIAKTSITMDTRIKPPIYAGMGVPDYWVVDVPGQRVIIFRFPGAEGYAKRTEHRAPETLQPLAVDVAALDLAALFA